MVPDDFDHEKFLSDIIKNRSADELKDKPWRKDAARKEPTNPDYPKTPFDKEHWMKSSKPMEEDTQIPQPGDMIRTKKMQMEGQVEKLGKSSAGYDEVFFRVFDGRLMKTPLSNVIVVQKLEDEELNEISNKLLAKYKTAAGKDASAADKAGDYKRGDKRFSGIVKATKKQFANDAKKSIDEEKDKDEFSKKFADLLGKQYKEVQPEKKGDVKKEKLSNNNFELWYRKPTDNLRPIQWQIRTSKDGIQKHEGSSSNIKDAFSDAEEWLATKSGSNKATNNVTVNFNAAFAREFTEQGDTIYCAFWEGPTLVYSLDPHKGLQKTSIRTSEHARTAGAAWLPATTLGPKKANEVGLKGNARYTLGPKTELAQGVYGFPLIWHSNVDGLRLSMNEPIIQTSTKDTEKDVAKEGSMGGINRCAPAVDVSYEKVLDEASADRIYLDAQMALSDGWPDVDPSDLLQPVIRKHNISWEDLENMFKKDGYSDIYDYYDRLGDDLGVLEEIMEKWQEELNELSVDTLKRYAAGAKSKGPGHDKVKTMNHIKGYHRAEDKIAVKTGDRTAPSRRQGPPASGTFEERLEELLDPWHGYTPDDPKANALKKAPKNAMQGMDDIRFSQMVQDTIDEHGLKWAFDFYVMKHGLPPRHFKIYAGL